MHIKFRMKSFSNISKSQANLKKYNFKIVLLCTKLTMYVQNTSPSLKNRCTNLRIVTQALHHSI